MKGTIGKGLIGQRPQAFCGLEFGRMGGQEDQVDACWNDKVMTGMPPRLVEHQCHLLALSGTDLLGEVRQDQTEDIGAHGRPELPLRLSGERLDKGIQVHPLVAVMDGGDGTLPTPRPHSAQERFQPDAMFVHRPEFDDVLRIGLLDFSHLAGEFFL